MLIRKTSLVRDTTPSTLTRAHPAPPTPNVENPLRNNEGGERGRVVVSWGV